MAKPPAPTTPAKPPRPIGRPSLYTPELAASILARLADGESLRAICRDDDMPNFSTVFEWIKRHPEFSKQYARAREIQAHAIATDAMDDALTASDPALGRLAFDARRWFAGKVAPKVYGDRPEGEAGTATNPLVVLLQQMQARALPVVPVVDGTAEDVTDE